MPVLCGKCCSDVGKEGDFLVCAGCDLSYHFNCSGIKKATYSSKSQESKASWRCAKCKSDKKSGSGTPSSDAALQVFDFGEGPLNAFLIEFREESREHFKILNEEVKKIRDDLAAQVKDLKSAVDTLKKENEEKDCVIGTLTNHINSLDQYGRKNNFELVNVEEIEGENIDNIVLKLAKTLDIDLTVNDIEAAHRIPSRVAHKTSRIIVQLSSRRKRDQFLEKKRFDFNSNVITGGLGQEGLKRVYINENLNPFYRELLWKSKERAKITGYKFVWFVSGKIFVRKDESSKKVIRIQSFIDLDKIV